MTHTQLICFSLMLNGMIALKFLHQNGVFSIICLWTFTTCRGRFSCPSSITFCDTILRNFDDNIQVRSRKLLICVYLLICGCWMNDNLNNNFVCTLALWCSWCWYYTSEIHLCVFCVYFGTSWWRILYYCYISFGRVCTCRIWYAFDAWNMGNVSHMKDSTWRYR